MQKILISQIGTEINKIKFRYKKKYGAAVFDVKVKSFNNFIILTGVVLAERQKNEIFLAAKEIIKSGRVKNEIKVLADPREKIGIGWGIIKSDIADIWAVFPVKKKTMRKGRISLAESYPTTQAIKGDIVRILAEKGGYFLVQTKDLAIGWIIRPQVSSIKPRVSDERWRNFKRAKPHEAIKAGFRKNSKNKFAAFLEKYLKVPYLWGGTTAKGIDCSGLSQKFYFEIFGILLPRNSRDQALCGKKINLQSAQFGDLFFLRHKEKKYPHIGIVVEKNSSISANRRIPENKKKTEDCPVLYAGREEGRAVIRDLSEILKSYNLISIKRIIIVTRGLDKLK